MNSAWFTVSGYEVRNDDLWVVATAVCASVACGLVGCFLVLRRMSLLGDAISHAILPGLAAAFLVTGSREPISMLTGALVVGVLTAVLSSGLSRWGRVSEDASMGVVFTTLFAIGVVLITWAARNVDLDPGCVLYGLIEFAPFDTMLVLGHELPRSFVWLAVILIVNATLIVVFFKELKVVSFDPFLATTMGISATLLHYALMTSVAATAVASFESVGSILVVAMLVAPGATAHLLTDRLAPLLWIAALLAALSAVAGYVAAVALNTSVAGAIATSSLALFVLVLFAAPRHGVIAKQYRQFALSARIRREDVLGLLFRWHEQVDAIGTAGHTPGPTTTDVASLTRTRWAGSLLVRWLRWSGLVVRQPDRSLRLTDAGVAESRRLVRGHRLWETYLAKRVGVDAARVHGAAHKAEHFLSDRLREDLHEDLGESTDPHGRSIPS